MDVLSNPISALWIGACIAIAMLVALLWAVFSVDKRVDVVRKQKPKPRRRQTSAGRGR